MLALTLALALGLQDPAPSKSWVTSGVDPAHVDAVVVSGTPELNPKAALDAAMREAHDGARARLAEHGAEVIRARAPFWLPAFVSDPVLRRWVDARSPAAMLQVLDQEQRVRDHGFGNSYQAFLLVREDSQQTTSGDRQLGSELQRAQKLFLGKCAGVAVGWALLGLIFSWLDRLSRGYMTMRLFAIGGAVATIVPAFLFLA